MIVLPDDSLKSIWDEAQKLHRLDPHTFTTSWGDPRQHFWWVNHLEYWYGQNEPQRIDLHAGGRA